MAEPVRVSCINRSGRTAALERIQNIGGVDPDGKRWKVSESQAIQGIKDGRWAFYTEPRPGHVTRVNIARRLGREYLKADTDSEHPDNPLALPECPYCTTS